MKVPDRDGLTDTGVFSIGRVSRRAGTTMMHRLIDPARSNHFDAGVADTKA